jgi:hypothetical protein
MGKTKTAVISGTPEDKLSGEEKYKKKQKEQSEKDKMVRAPGLGGGQRIKSVDAGPMVDETKSEAEEKESTSRWRRPRVRGGKYKSARAKIDKKKTYEIEDAVELVQQMDYAKFDATVEMHINVTKKDINKRVKLPHSTGVEKKVEIADADTIKKLKKGNIDFDILLAKPEMMPKIVPFAQLTWSKRNDAKPKKRNPNKIRKRS